jgi:hypothetical protein
MVTSPLSLRFGVIGFTETAGSARAALGFRCFLVAKFGGVGFNGDVLGFPETASEEGGDFIKVAPAWTAAVLVCTNLTGAGLISVAPACTAATWDLTTLGTAFFACTSAGLISSTASSEVSEDWPAYLSLPPPACRSPASQTENASRPTQGANMNADTMT